MENASKAIIMAGAVLLSIIVITMMVLLWKQYSDYSLQNEENMRAQQVNEFNTKFEKYQYNDISQNYIAPHEVRTIVNLVNDYNEEYQEKVIKLTYNGGNDILEWGEQKWIEFFNNSLKNPDVKYKCIITQPASKDIIREIKIQKVNS